MSYVEIIQSKFQPDIVPTDGAASYYLLRGQILAFGVGLVAFGLPVAMLISSISGTCRYDSVSHYYYSRFAGDVFVGALFFIGSFLLAYRGEAHWENRLSKVAGFCAFGVALFPTSGAGCKDDSFPGRAFVSTETNEAGSAIVTVEIDSQFALFSWVDVVHFGSAGILFATLAFFCFFVFTRVLADQRRSDGSPTPEKIRRDTVYRWSGRVIVAAIAALGIRAVFFRDWGGWNEYNLTFVMETIALWAFGLSWVVKGRLGPFKDTGLGRMVLDARDRRNPVR